MKVSNLMVPSHIYYVVMIVFMQLITHRACLLISCYHIYNILITTNHYTVTVFKVTTPNIDSGQ